MAATSTVLLFSPKLTSIPFQYSSSDSRSLFFSIPNPRFLRCNKNSNSIRRTLSSSRIGGGIQPSETECPVPVGQQPVNEYQSLSTSFPFSWAFLDTIGYSSRLLAIGVSFTLLVGLPVSWFGMAGAESEPLNRVLGAVSSGIFVATLVVLRMYLGWAYVGNRLLSATVEYEETGWYNGQVWVKTAEVLARDRLLGSFSVKPMLGRLKLTLIGLAASLLACVIVALNTGGSPKDGYEMQGGGGASGVYNEESVRLFELDANHY